ncbi:MAG: DUF86 domain-containing protein [Deltaproteobacteria bacterium]|nr:MAG: DUF86 domain-containing protein [Deltaproteobacteria bacterium]RLC09258.1 MAG: DUF86 domain-containing protein [Deltaproteobacteria bacterium]
MKKSIERKIKSVEERLERLSALSESLPSFENYQASTDKKDIAERNIQVAIETCLDIGKIIISSKKLSEPKDNKGIFIVLSEAGYLTSESLSFMVPMAGTRNILVHGYDKVDDGLIFGILKRHLIDFFMFLKQIRDNYLMKI